MRTFIIVPTHNKEHLIEQVYDGIASNISKQLDYKIIFIADGCTDQTVTILNNYTEKHGLQDNTILLTAPDVHEIKSLNIGLSYIEESFKPDDDDLIFTVQDDVVIQEPNFDLYFKKLNEKHNNTGYITWRLGCSLSTDGVTLNESNFVESEFGHWSVHKIGPPFQQIKHKQFAITEAVIRSPTCVLWKRYKEVGFYNEDLAPCGFDCHDMSIRMNKAGYKNGILALKYQSDVDWGSTREKPQTEVNSKIGEIFERNKRHVVQTYKDYFNYE
tara:strand:- start:209 stop:1024 length:816 start_codon:yes stop_codon:yes gene_type:complete